MVTIPLETIARPQDIDRIDISDQELCELAANIKEVGLLQNPLVRANGDGYEIVAGDRRIMAIRKLGWTEMDVVLCEMTDLQAAEARASENLQRVNLTVIEEARIYLNLKMKHGRTVDQIAEAFGISAGTVQRRIDLLKMDQSLQDAMHKKLISYGVAEALSPITDKTALSYYLGFACDHGVTVAIARQWCADWKSSMRRMQDNSDPANAIVSAAVIQPTYLACDLCHEPEEVQNFTHLKLCRDCAKRLAKARFDDE